MGLYNFIRRAVDIGLGVGNQAFVPSQALPVQTAIGPATAVRRLRTVYQPPMVYLGSPVIVTNGLGGLQHGTIVFQPLVQNP